MNPSAQRIRELFALNDPTNYYWDNFRRFLQGHSYKDRARLLGSNAWTPDQSRAMLAIAEGISPVDWFKMPSEQKAMALLLSTNIRKSPSPPDAPVDPIAVVRFNVLGPCWDEVSSRGKFNAWNAWSSGVTMLDKEGKAFALNKMKMWRSQSQHDSEMKLQALVSTMDELSENMRNQELTDLFEEYQAMLLEEAKRMQEWTVTGIESVQTWRQLQGYPDFLVGVRHPHPWMESMCVAHTGSLARDLSPAVVFRNQYGRLCGVKLARDVAHNASNPLDRPLAQALQRHFMGQDPRPEREVQGLFALLEDSGGIVSTLLSMGTMGVQPTFDVAGELFDLAP